MKIITVLKFIFLIIFLIFIVNACSIKQDEDATFEAHKIVFLKSTQFNWKNKKVEVSFEDAFQQFLSIDSISSNKSRNEFSLSVNNLAQGIAVRFKVVDEVQKKYKITEIMIEPYDLSRGINQFSIGYTDNKPYIIY